jgi:general secretion pathway protein G
MNHKNLSKLLILFLVFQIFACRNNQMAQQNKETILRENLTRIRENIDQYFSDNQKYPPNLKELVRRDYFKTIPIDPITRRDNTWILVYEERDMNTDPNAELGITDVHSGADGQCIDGTPYSEL